MRQHHKPSLTTLLKYFNSTVHVAIANGMQSHSYSIAEYIIIIAMIPCKVTNKTPQTTKT